MVLLLKQLTSHRYLCFTIDGSRGCKTRLYILRKSIADSFRRDGVTTLPFFSVNERTYHGLSVKSALPIDKCREQIGMRFCRDRFYCAITFPSFSAVFRNTLGGSHGCVLLVGPRHAPSLLAVPFATPVEAASAQCLHTELAHVFDLSALFDSVHDVLDVSKTGCKQNQYGPEYV